MTKALVISSIPFSRSNRGIDLITQALSGMGVETTHLACASKRYLNTLSLLSNGENEAGIQQDFLALNMLGYSERIMGDWPKWLANIFIKLAIFGKDYDFSSYDLIVVESGKPTFLTKLLPFGTPVVYRQSDPMSIMSRNKAMYEVEKQIIRRADGVLCVRSIPGNTCLYGIGETKATIIENGFDATPMQGYCRKANRECTRRGRAVYVGYTPINAELMLLLARTYPQVDFNIVGACLDKKGKALLMGCDNVILHGSIDSSEYLPIVVSADIGIVPLSSANYLNGIGMNSKYLMFMYMGLPVVSVDVGGKNEFPRSPFLSFCGTYQEFIDAFGRYLDLRGACVSYDVDFEAYSKTGRIKLYEGYFGNILAESFHVPG